MAFQFTTSPGPSTSNTTVKRCNEECGEIPILSLAPFSSNIKLCFENVVVGTSSVLKLLLMNPSARDLEVSIKNIPLPENGVKMSWQQHTIPANGKVLLEISWVPTREEVWRHTLTFVDGRRVKKDVGVTFKSTLAKKTKYSKSKQGKFTVVSKKIKSPPKRMSPKSSSHKYQALLLKKNMSPQRTKSSSTTKSSMLENGMFALRNKENLDPSVKGNLVSQITYNDGELFQSPRGATFNTEPINDQIRRETFTVKSGKNQFTKRSTNCYSKNMSNDSSEELQPDLKFTFSKSPNIVNNGNLSDNTHLPEAIPVRNTLTFVNHIKLKSDSSSFMFTSTTPVRTIDNFTPTLGNLCSSTYVKDNSVGNLASMSISPNSTKKITSTSRNVSPLFGETVSNIDGVLSLSPILKDSSKVRLANMSGENPLKRKSTTIFDVSPPKKIILDSTKRMPDHRQPLKWNKSKTVPDEYNRRRSIECLDPFLRARLYHDQQWIEEQEIRIKKWLNTLLTPPTELDSNTDGHPLDVAKLWQQCKHKAIPVAPSKEVNKNKYHTNKRLDALRKTATNLFLSDEVNEVLDKALKTVESRKLSIRSNKDIHLDFSLQLEVMILFLSYNPLWLRIGLETIYGTTIPLSSNSDIMGLSSFIMQRFFRDPFLLKKHKSVHSPKYVVDIKKFILTKFLIFVYFLDVAKCKVLIAHDPCLFCKNAPIKESHEILLKFSRELLPAAAHFPKCLRFTGYTVRHTQKYIHEFDYSVIHLGVDLRDGVRLTKVMEIILIRTGLTDGLRTPAISRLQKTHNMKIVFDALQKANFEIVGDISFKDIVDGHQEKTLSFLWQIIDKFQAPLFLMKASITIQTWWRSLQIVVKRRILLKKQHLREAAALKIQRSQDMKKAAIILQRRFRANQMMKIERGKFQELKKVVIFLQRRFSANRAMVSERSKFLQLKKVTLRIQRRFRANKAMKIEETKFQDMKKSAIILQRRFRSNKAVNDERARFLNYKSSRNNAATKIQTCWRGYRTRKEHPEMADIRENAKQSTLKAIPDNTLGHRRERAMQIVYGRNSTVFQINRALEELEFITRRCKNTCLRLSRILPEQLYLIMYDTNRSSPRMQECTVAISFLINFCKYRRTASKAWRPQHIDTLIMLMSHCCDKEDKLFSYLCTLMWLFAHNEQHKQDILSIPNCASRILQIKALCLRKEKMESLKQHKTASYFSPYHHLPLPTLFPDWGLDYPDRPRTFVNSLHGLSSLLTILDLD